LRADALESAFGGAAWSNREGFGGGLRIERIARRCTPHSVDVRSDRGVMIGTRKGCNLGGIVVYAICLSYDALGMLNLIRGCLVAFLEMSRDLPFWGDILIRILSDLELRSTISSFRLLSSSDANDRILSS
jgi:hypothetical protein